MSFVKYNYTLLYIYIYIIYIDQSNVNYFQYTYSAQSLTRSITVLSRSRECTVFDCEEAEDSHAAQCLHAPKKVASLLE